MNRPIIGKTLKHLSYIALIFFVYILQTTIFVHLPILGQKPLLLPLTVTAILVTEGGELGAIYGLLAGLFCDVSLNQSTVIFTFSLTAIGALGGYLNQRFLEDGILGALFCGFVVLTLCAGIQAFPLLVYRHAEIPSLAVTSIVQTLYSLPFLVPMYYLCRLIVKIPSALRYDQ